MHPKKSLSEDITYVTSTVLSKFQPRLISCKTGLISIEDQAIQSSFDITLRVL